MYGYGLQIVVGVLIFAIHYFVMTRLTPLLYRPQFKWYSIIVHVAFLLYQVYTWFFTVPESFMTIMPVTFYSSIFAPLFGVLIYRIYRYLMNPDRDLVEKWRNLMLVVYISVMLIFLYLGYYLFTIIYY